MLLGIFAIPLAYLASLVALLIRRRGVDVGISLLCCAATLGAGAWSILQSRASTAGIGFLFLPVIASVSGALGLAYAASRRSGSAAVRALGLVCLVTAGVPAAIELRGGRETITKNARRDADQLRRDEALARHRTQVDALVAGAGDGARDTLEALLRRHPNDRELVLAVLEHPELSERTLDSLAGSGDLGIALRAVQNAGTPAATLERVFRTHPNRTYFFQALAANAHTPPALLREISAVEPAPITGLDIWLAGNPSTPADVLRDVARASESIHAVRQLLQHPALDCTMIESVARGPAMRANPDDADVRERLAAARASRCR